MKKKKRKFQNNFVVRLLLFLEQFSLASSIEMNLIFSDVRRDTTLEIQSEKNLRKFLIERIFTCFTQFSEVEILLVLTQFRNFVEILKIILYFIVCRKKKVNE